MKAAQMPLRNLRTKQRRRLHFTDPLWNEADDGRGRGDLARPPMESERIACALLSHTQLGNGLRRQIMHKEDVGDVIDSMAFMFGW